MYRKPTKDTNGINLALLKGTLTLVAKVLKIHPNTVRKVAHDKVLQSQGNNSTTHMIVHALKKVEKTLNEIEELGNKYRNDKRRKPTAE